MEHKENLAKLATYLESLPADYRHFDMSWWFHGSSASYASGALSVPECGTSACALGHGPAAGIPLRDAIMPNGRISWDRYKRQFVPAATSSAARWPEQLTELWLFGGSWAKYDNSVAGAAARIRYYLENGGIPKGFDGRLTNFHNTMQCYAPYRKDEE